MQDNVAGDLKQDVSPEENSGRESKLLACDPQLPIHRQCCESEIDSVDECNHVESKQEWEKSYLEFPDRSLTLHSTRPEFKTRITRTVTNLVPLRQFV